MRRAAAPTPRPGCWPSPTPPPAADLRADDGADDPLRRSARLANDARNRRRFARHPSSTASIAAAPVYRGGVVRSTHVPRSGEHGFHIGPDQFRNRFVVEAPIDGFGQPRIYLSLLRQVCSNGAVGYSPAFRSDIRMGNDAAYTLERALGQFDHDEGFAALRQRFESAQKSWASIRETMLLHKTISRLGDGRDGRLRGRRLHEELNRVAGDLNALYGLANLETLSAKRQRVLPAKCRVYDLINFASELATHGAAAGRPDPPPGLHRHADLRRVRPGGHGGEGAGVQ